MNGGYLTHCKYSRHRQTAGYPRVGMCRHGADIVCEQHASCLRCLFQHYRIWGSSKTYILRPYYIQSGQTAQHATHNVIIKTFVYQKTE